MFADDRGWMRRMHDAVRGVLTAEAAVQKIQHETRGRMAAIKDPYLHARLADLDDLGNRLLHHLLGLEEKRDEHLPLDLVLIAADLGQIGRAHVRTPVTNAQLVCRLLLAQ